MIYKTFSAPSPLSANEIPCVLSIKTLFGRRVGMIITRINFIEFCDEEGYALLNEINSDSTLTTISATENGWIEIYINIPVFKFLFAV